MARTETLSYEYLVQKTKKVLRLSGFTVNKVMIDDGMDDDWGRPLYSFSHDSPDIVLADDSERLQVGMTWLKTSAFGPKWAYHTRGRVAAVGLSVVEASQSRFLARPSTFSSDGYLVPYKLEIARVDTWDSGYFREELTASMLHFNNYLNQATASLVGLGMEGITPSRDEQA